MVNLSVFNTNNNILLTILEMSGYGRNEFARQSRRQSQKEQYGLVSVPASVLDLEAITRGVTRKEEKMNHFGWKVKSKKFRDREFERLMMYQEKPYLPGRESNNSSTYVVVFEDRMKAGTGQGHVNKRPSAEGVKGVAFSGELVDTARTHNLVPNLKWTDNRQLYDKRTDIEGIVKQGKHTLKLTKEQEKNL